VIWIRRWLKSGAPIVDMSSAEVLTYLERLDRKGRFAVFQLPDRGSFVQVIRNGSGGLELEVSRRMDAVERILGQVFGRRGIEHDGSDRAIDRGVFAVVELAKLGGGIELGAVGHDGKCGRSNRPDW